MSDSIRTDESSTDISSTLSTLDDGANAFLKRWTDPDEDQASDEDVEEAAVTEPNETEGEDDEEVDEAPSAEEDESSEEDPSKTDKTERRLASDEDEITYTVDGQEYKASVKDLKRLAGQEAALTRKSQEVAQLRRMVEDQGNKHLVGLQSLQQKAAERYKPFADLDYILAAKNMSDEDFQALREEGQKAYQEYTFLTQELDNHLASYAYEQSARQAAMAQEAVRYLSDPNTGIPGWGQEMYGELRNYAINNGMAQHVVDNIVDPIALKLLHKAYAYDNMKKAATTKKAAAPKKVMRSSVSTPGAKNGTSNKALKQLRASGRQEDAMNVFLSRWGDAGDD